MSGFKNTALTSAQIAAAGGLLAANNLSDLGTLATAQANLGMGIVKIASQLLAAQGNFDFQNIPATYQHLLVVLQARSIVAGASDSCSVRFNNDSGANYDRQRILGAAALVTAAESLGATQGDIGQITGATGTTAGNADPIHLWVPNYARTTYKKGYLATGGISYAEATTNTQAGLFVGKWRSTAAIAGVTIFGSANFDVGSVATLYGLL